VIRIDSDGFVELDDEAVEPLARQAVEAIR
jgi:hypothetical protein